MAGFPNESMNLCSPTNPSDHRPAPTMRILQFDGPALHSSQSVGGRVQPRMERTLGAISHQTRRRNSAPRPFPILWRLGRVSFSRSIKCKCSKCDDAKCRDGGHPTWNSHFPIRAVERVNDRQVTGQAIRTGGQSPGGLIRPRRTGQEPVEKPREEKLKIRLPDHLRGELSDRRRKRPVGCNSR